MDELETGSQQRRFRATLLTWSAGGNGLELQSNLLGTGQHGGADLKILLGPSTMQDSTQGP